MQSGIPARLAAGVLALGSCAHASAVPPKDITIIDLAPLSRSEQIMCSSIAGVVNRESPEVFLTHSGIGISDPGQWVDRLLPEFPEVTPHYTSDSGSS